MHRQYYSSCILTQIFIYIDQKPTMTNFLEVHETISTKNIQKFEILQKNSQQRLISECISVLSYRTQ